MEDKMNETELDNIFEILEEGYYESLEFAHEQCLDDDEETFGKMFQDKLRPTLIKIREYMTEIAESNRGE